MIDYTLKGTVAVRRGREFDGVLGDIQAALDDGDPCVATSDGDDDADLVCVDVDYAGKQSGAGVEHVRGLMLRLSALAVRPTVFVEGLDGDLGEQYLGGTRREARSAMAAETIVAALDDLIPRDLKDVVELVLARWRDVQSGG